MAKPRSNRDLIHQYCNGRADDVRVNSMSIRNGALYSYNLAIARFVGDTLLIHRPSSTPTTNTQKSVVRSAASHLQVMYVEDVTGAIRNYSAVEYGIKPALAEASRARTRRPEILSALRSRLVTANTYSEMEGYDKRFDVDATIGTDLKELAAAERKAAAAERAENAAKRAKVLVDNAEAFERWKLGEGIRLPYADNVPTLLRVNGEQIETSRGAHVPLSVAPTLWKLVERARAKHNDYEPGMQLGGYRLTKITPNGDIVVGCHQIEYSELKRIAVQLGYIQQWGVYNSIAESYWGTPGNPTLFDSKELAEAYIKKEQTTMETDDAEGSAKIYSPALTGEKGQL